MHVKKACLVINPRGGQNVAKIRDILAVFAAVDWETDIVIKQYGGHAIELATQAAKEGRDLVIAYGGDGTVNQVVNGVMIAADKGCHSTVGVIPGGTVNLWATELGIPFDPVKAALTLVMSHGCKADVGHIEVQGFMFPGTTQGNEGDGQLTSSLLCHAPSPWPFQTRIAATCSSTQRTRSSCMPFYLKRITKRNHCAQPI